MRQRVTVSLPEALLENVDRITARIHCDNRSAVFERALQLLLRSVRDSEIDAQLDEYFSSQTQGERAEERTMVRSFARSRRKVGLD